METSDLLLGDDLSGLYTLDASDEESATLTIPAGIAEGTYYILFVADYKNENNETNENNNVSYNAISVSSEITTPFSASEDTYVISSVPTLTSGSSTLLIFGINNNNTETINSLIKFDDISSIPSGSIIKNAVLKLYITNVDKAIPTGITIYQIWTKDWSESSVNWDNQPSLFSTNYSSLNVSFASTTQNKYHSFNVTGWVKNWIEEKQNNFGFMLKSSNNSIFFHSSENSNVPILEITYE